MHSKIHQTLIYGIKIIIQRFGCNRTLLGGGRPVGRIEKEVLIEGEGLNKQEGTVWIERWEALLPWPSTWGSVLDGTRRRDL